MARLDDYLRLTVSEKASDLHFSSNQPTRLRVDGDLVSIDEEALTADDIRQIFVEALGEDEFAKFEKARNLDRSYALPGTGNFRLNLFMTRLGPCAVMRTIPEKIPTMEQLGLPAVMRQLAESHKGLILVTGPTGSGKSTTLAAMLNYINTSFPYHILTAEDPVEFVHPSKKSLVNQREIGTTCPTFADALKYALREDPDVILVGEMRDQETIGLALTAAETGHLVVGTLHTRGAGASIDRIIDSFPANQQPMVRTMLSESLVAVISQALLKRATGKGRVAAYEIMVVNHAISNLLREGKSFQIGSIMQTGKKDGMQLMDQHIKELIADGVVTAEEGEAYLIGSGHGKPKAPTPTGARTSTGDGKVAGAVAAPKNTFDPGAAKPLSTGQTGVHDLNKMQASSAAKSAPATPVAAAPTLARPAAPAPAARPAPIPRATAAPTPKTPAPPPLAAGAKPTAPPPRPAAAPAASTAATPTAPSATKRTIGTSSFTVLSGNEEAGKQNRSKPTPPKVSPGPLGDGSEVTLTDIPVSAEAAEAAADEAETPYLGLDAGTKNDGAGLIDFGSELDLDGVEETDMGGDAEETETPAPPSLRKKTG